jgi:CheY-like chemotaxis protein
VVATHSFADEPIRVLVVDDNVDITQSLSRALRSLGYRVETAGDGLDAIETAVKFRPNVVVLDLMLPILSGWDVARTLRSVALFARPKLIALSGLGAEQHRAASRSAGFEHHLTKPVSLSKLQLLLGPSRAA